MINRIDVSNCLITSKVGRSFAFLTQRHVDGKRKTMHWSQSKQRYDKFLECSTPSLEKHCLFQMTLAQELGSVINGNVPIRSPSDWFNTVLLCTPTARPKWRDISRFSPHLTCIFGQLQVKARDGREGLQRRHRDKTSRHGDMELYRWRRRWSHRHQKTVFLICRIKGGRRPNDD